MSLIEHPERTQLYRTSTLERNPSSRARLVHSARTIVRHVTKHVGVGIICSVAYFDPGNWSVDLQAGSLFGYRPMLFVLLMAGLGAMVLQSLAFKLGCVTGLDLAAHCRVLLYDRPRHKRLIRFTVLYPLYVLCEIAIVSTDLAELLGSAIGLCLIFPSIPLWAGVLITASDVLIFLILGDPSRGHGRPVRVFEYTVMALVAAVFICFLILLVKVSPHWGQAFEGFLPSKKLFQTKPDALYTAVGILGATVMPHALFLGSYLSTQDRVTPAPTLPVPASARPTDFKSRVRDWWSSLFTISRSERVSASKEYRDKYDHQNNQIDFIRAHLGHGLVDVILSLLGVAVPINAAILIIAATVFFKDGSSASAVPAGLFDAHDLIRENIGKAAAFIFALALLCAGQTASITATLAGQIVSEGFIEWRVSPFLRRIITRSIGLVPSMVVAIAVGREGIDTLLVASQVALSIVLPFVAAPLILLTSSKRVMSVRGPPPEADMSVDEQVTQLPVLPAHPSSDSVEEISESPGADPQLSDGEKHAIASAQKAEEKAKMVVHSSPSSGDEDGFISFTNHWAVTTISAFIFVIILAANVYAIVMLGLGKAS
ncbi:natural resistance-associated macrophage protein [Trametes elegans]|nr:natural resistance-associated macrophage protein [Trametes elegans]